MRNQLPAHRSDEPGSLSGLNRRRHVRVPFTASARLMLDTPGGLVTLSGSLLDISMSGCALHLNARVDAQLAGRVRLSIEGREVWFPITTRWVRSESRGWRV